MPDRIRHRTRPSSSPELSAEQVLPAVVEPSVPSDRSDDPDAYEVGYGKPPVHSRFKPGVSGNPRGRPKGSRSIATLIEQELNERVTVRENGREIRIRKRNLVVKQIVKKAAEGDQRAFAMIQRLEAERQLDSVTTLNDNQSEHIFGPERDREILEQYHSMLDGGGVTAADEDEARAP